MKQAFSFEHPDRLPVFDSFWDEFADNWRRAQNISLKLDIEDYYWSDMKVLVAKEEFFPTHIGIVSHQSEYVYRNDGWGRIVRTKPNTYFVEPVERVFNKLGDLDRIQFDAPELDVRYTEFLDHVNHHRQKGRAVFVKIGGPFIRSTYFRGETQFLMDLAEDEYFARAIAEKVGEHLLQIGLESLKRADAYDFGVWIYDDMCNSNAPMFSPRTFEKVFLPVYQHIVSALKAAGARWVILHCDGNLTALLDMVVEAGIDGVNPVEPGAGMDIAKLLEVYVGRLRFIGGVCNTHVLPSGDPERIRRHVERIVDVSRNGGVIIGTHSVGPDISLESYELYRTIVKERYQLTGKNSR